MQFQDLRATSHREATAGEASHRDSETTAGEEDLDEGEEMMECGEDGECEEGSGEGGDEGGVLGGVVGGGETEREEKGVCVVKISSKGRKKKSTEQPSGSRTLTK